MTPRVRDFYKCFIKTRYHECIQLCNPPLHALPHLHINGLREVLTLWAEAGWGSLSGREQRRGTTWTGESLCLLEQLEAWELVWAAGRAGGVNGSFRPQGAPSITQLASEPQGGAPVSSAWLSFALVP